MTIQTTRRDVSRAIVGGGIALLAGCGTPGGEGEDGGGGEDEAGGGGEGDGGEGGEGGEGDEGEDDVASARAALAAPD